TDSIFFSSRRRHTRSKRDWSSDVCSSDLVGAAPRSKLFKHCGGAIDGIPSRTCSDPDLSRRIGKALSRLRAICLFQVHQRRIERSEERRVGKEGRSRWGSAEYE